VPVDTFPAEIRLANAVAALAQARAALGSTTGSTTASTTASIDLAGLTVFDSAALAVLAALRRDLGGSLRFANPPANLRKLAALYGVDALLFDCVDPPAAASS
jgi:ABC-type transporter Mla MlaB component